MAKGVARDRLLSAGNPIAVVAIGTDADVAVLIAIPKAGRGDRQAAAAPGIVVPVVTAAGAVLPVALAVGGGLVVVEIVAAIIATGRAAADFGAHDAAQDRADEDPAGAASIDTDARTYGAARQRPDHPARDGMVVRALFARAVAVGLIGIVPAVGDRPAEVAIVGTRAIESHILIGTVPIVGQESAGSVLGVIVGAGAFIGVMLPRVDVTLGREVAGLVPVAGLGVLVLALQALIVLLLLS